MSDAMSLGTVLLEANRWTAEKRPSFNVSAWGGAIAAAGFDGLELWENHAALAVAQEQEALRTMPLPVAVLNSYCTFDDAGSASRQRAAQLAHRLGASGVKFNFGNDPARAAEYVANLRAWADELPAGCRLLCEGHANTVLEDPDHAARLLAPLADRVEFIVHAFSGERDLLRRWLTRCGPAVTHVHAAGHSVKAGYVRLRDMADEARARLALLREAGFAGTWTVEFTAGVGQPGEDRRALLANAAADRDFLMEEGKP